MTLTWYGHSCFLIDEKNYKIVVDPYADGSVPGYPKLRLEANQVLYSHDHADHRGQECVKIVESDEVCPFQITKIETNHDDQNGSLRGKNIIHILESNDEKIIHMGDIGCKIEDDRLKSADVMLMPVGGYYTLEPNQVHELIHMYQPKVLIPMHYRFGSYGYPEIGTLDTFLKDCDNVQKYESNTFVVDEPFKNQTIVLTY